MSLLLVCGPLLTLATPHGSRPEANRPLHTAAVGNNDDDSVLDGPDLDDDNDGIPDTVEGTTDTDGDGLRNSFDLDSDNDGIPDAVEANNGVLPANMDGSGKYPIAYVNVAANSGTDGMVNAVQTTPLPDLDQDGDNLRNRLDRDSDNDGLVDAREANGGALPTGINTNGTYTTFTDTDADGIHNNVDPNNGGTALALTNTDATGRPDFLDLDADDDGMTDWYEAQSLVADNTTASPWIRVLSFSTNAQGQQIATINDDDTDGILDPADPNGGTALVPIDSDGDGTPDYRDLDTDADGVSDRIEWNDYNHDGAPDNTYAATDTDNDGLVDVYDSENNTSGTLNNNSGFDNLYGLATPAGNVTDYGMKSLRPNADFDYLLDWRDTDDDNDGILTANEDVSGNYLVYTQGGYYTQRSYGVTPVIVNEPDYLHMKRSGSLAPDKRTAVLDWNYANPYDGSPGGNQPNAYLSNKSFKWAGVTVSIDNFRTAAAGSNPITTTISQAGTPPQTTATQSFGPTYNKNPILETDKFLLYGDQLSQGFFQTLANGGAAGGYSVARYTFSQPLRAVTMGLVDLDAAVGSAAGTQYEDDIEIVGYRNGVAVTLGAADVLANTLTVDVLGDPTTPIHVAGTSTVTGSRRVVGNINAPGTVPTKQHAANVWFSFAVPIDELRVIYRNANNRTGVQIVSLGELRFTNTDFDGDNVADAADLDSDNDGIVDLTETNNVNVFADTDNDGIPNYLDANTAGWVDTNTDGVDDRYDRDLDGLINPLDRDSDNDGITDTREAGGTDANGDGILDGFTDTATIDGKDDTRALTPANLDGDTLANYLDLDSDNDGITDAREARQTGLADTNSNGIADAYTVTSPDLNLDGLADALISTSTPANLDGDANPDYLDRDSDNDGLTDTREAGGTDATGDGIIDGFTDTNGDGLNNTALTPADFDGDGLDNYVDRDSDQDGITDTREAGYADATNNGISDAATTDANADGLYDAAITATLPANTDGNGAANYLDRDSDDDGLVDAIEGGGADADGDGIIDGFADSNGDGLNNTASAPADLDGDGLANYLDRDSDSDGIWDLLEIQATTGRRALAGADADADGIDNNFDKDFNAAYAITTPNNLDGADTADYLDLNSDNDAAPDWTEGFDNNANGYALDDLRTRATTFVTNGGNNTYYPNATDTNANGLPDWLDDADADGTPNFLDFGNTYYRDSNNNGLVDLYDPASFGVASTLPSRLGGEADFRRTDAVAPLVYTISGTVFEDLNYGGGSGRSIATANAVTAGSAVGVGTAGTAATAATVELYTSAGVYVMSTTTSTTAGSLGQYSFNVAPGTYTVRVVNGTVRSTRPGTAAGLLPVQTYNGTTTRVGGEYPARTDAAARSGTQTLADLTPAAGTTAAQSIFATTISAANATAVDFGFNFSTIVNTRASGQGSLAQFITNANTLTNAGLDQAAASTGGTDPAAGTETSIFMIPNGGTTAGGNVRAGFTSYDASTNPGLVSQLTGGVAVITPTAALPTLSDPNTSINGSTQTQNIGNTNTATLGVGGTVGTGTDGIVGTADDVALTTLSGPEVQLVGTLGQTGNDYGLRLSANNLTVRGLAIYGFGTVAGSTNTGNIYVEATTTGGAQTGTLITENVIGTTAASFSDVGAATRGPATGIYLGGSYTGVLGATISNNLIGYNSTGGIENVINGGAGLSTAGLQVTGNEIRGNAVANATSDGIRVGSAGAYISGNLFADTRGPGIDWVGSTGTVTVINNTIANNGLSGSSAATNQTPGLRVGGAGNTISQNIIRDNYGAGILVRTGTTTSVFSKNSIYGNGANDPDGAGALTTSGQVGIDLQLTAENSADAQAQGTSPYRSLNSDTDTGANGLLNYPVLTSATVQGTSLILKGYAPAGSSIELFVAQANAVTAGATAGNDFGQGKTYLTTLTAGAATAGASYSGTINGFAQGSSSTVNAFNFTIPLTAAQQALVTAGVKLTSTATLASATSEFSGNVNVNTAPVPVTRTNNVTIPNTSGATALTLGLSAAANGTFNGGTNSIAYYTVTSLPASGTLTYSGTVLNTGNIGSTQITNPALLTYTPVSGFAGGSVSFAYTATDANGVVSTTNNNGGTITAGAATYTIPVGLVANVATTLTGPATITANTATATFTVTFSNSGPNPALNVTRIVTLPPGATMTPAQVTASGGTYTAPASTTTSGTLNFGNVASLASGPGSSFTFAYVPFNGNTSPVSTSSTITTDSDEVGATANNTASVPSNVRFVPVANNDTQGTPANSNVNIDVVANDTDGNGNNTINALTIDLDPIAPGQQKTFTYTYGLGFTGGEFTLIENGVNAGQVQFNPATGFLGTATASYTVADNTGLVSNAATITVPISAVADVTTTITASPTPSVNAGGQLVFTVDFTNNGPSAASQVTRAITLPAGLGAGNVTVVGGGSYNNTNGQINIPGNTTLTNGQTLTSTVTILVVPASFTSIAAGSTVGTSTSEGIGTGVAANTASSTVTVTPVANVATTLTGPATITANTATANFTVTFSNSGPSAALDVTRIVTLPPGATMTPAQVTASGGTYTAPASTTTSGTLNFGNVASLASGPGSSFTFAYVPFNGNTSPVNTTSTITTSTVELAGTTANNTASVPSDVRFAPVATNDVATTPANTSVNIDAVANDTDGNGNNTIVASTIDLNPALALQQTTVAVTGGTFTLLTTGANAGQVQFVPTAGFTGVAVANYTVQDNTGVVSNPAATITVNVGPLTANDVASTTRLAAVTSDVTANDTDVNGKDVTTVRLIDPVGGARVTSVTTTLGTFTVNTTTGIVTFTPTGTGTATGPVSVDYSFFDALAGNPALSTTGTLTVTVVNIAPVAANVTSTPAIPNNSLQAALSPLSASDADGSIASYTVLTVPSAATQGTLYYNNGGAVYAALPANTVLTPAQAATLRFTPVNGLEAGSYTFTYQATDNEGQASNAATYTVPVTSPGPLAVDNEVATLLNAAVTINATGNDQLNGGPALSPATLDLDPFTAGVQDEFVIAGQGTFTYNAATVGFALSPGEVRFIPVTGFAGIANTPYTISNASGQVSNQANLVVRIQSQTDLTTSITSPASGTSVTAGASTTISGTTGNAGDLSTAVVQTVRLVPGLTGVSGTRNGVAAGTYTSATGVFAFPSLTLNSGETQPWTITFNAPGSGPFTAVATVPTAGDIALGNNTALVELTVAPRFDLLTTLTGPASVVTGNLATYVVSTRNAGPSAVTGAVQTVALPANLVGVFVTNGGAYDPGTGVVTFGPVSLASGQAVNNTISFSPTAAFTPTATVTPNTAGAGDANTANNQAGLNGSTFATPTAVAVTGATAAQANLYTTVTGPELVNPGQTNVTYTVEQGNDGPGAASGVQTVVALPAGLTTATFTVRGMTGTNGTGANLNNILFALPAGAGQAVYNTLTGLLTLPTLGSNQASAATPESYALVLTAPTAGSLVVSAAVRSTSTDPVPANNLSMVHTQLTPAADLSITVVNTAGTGNMPAGQTTNYIVRTVNNSQLPAQAVAQTVGMVPDLDVNSIRINGATGTLNGSNIEFGDATYNVVSGLVTFAPVATLDGGSTLNNVISFTFPALAGTTMALATVGSSTPDLTPANNTSRISNTTTATKDLSVLLSGPSQVVVGAPAFYTITSTNNGPSADGNLQTTVQLPTGLNAATMRVNNAAPTGTVGNVSTFATNLTYDASTGVLSFPNVGVPRPGFSLVNTVQFNAPATTQLSLAAAVVSTGVVDTEQANNTASISTPVLVSGLGNADLVTTVSNPGNQVVGTLLTYSVVTTNNGPTVAENVVRTIELPANLDPAALTLGGSTGSYNAGTGVVSFGSGATYDRNTGLLTLPTLTSLGTGTGNATTTSIVFPMPAAGSVVVASSLADNPDSNTANNTARNAVTATGRADYYTSVSGPATALPGSTVAYTIVTGNNGPSATGNNLVATVTLPGTVSYSLNGAAAVTGSSFTISAGTTQSGGSNLTTLSFVVPTGATSLAVTSSITSTNTTEPAGSTANNTSTATTTVPNLAPVANNVVNALQSPQGNTAVTALDIADLSGADADGLVDKFVVGTVPNATTYGTLYYDNAGTKTPVTSGQQLTPTEAASLSFDPVATYIGSVFFTYQALDNLGLLGNTALYTIQVGQDNDSKYTPTPSKGGASTYQDNDVLAYVIDPNGAKYNGSGLVYETTGAPATGAVANGLALAVLTPTSGPGSTTPPTGNASNTLPSGTSLNPATGQIYVSDRTLLPLVTTTTTYTVNITTTDVFGGVTTKPVSFTIGAFPLPVELTVFTAQAVGNTDALLEWTTASEKNNAYFEVERSLNGRDFAAVGRVQGQGSTARPTDYALTDAGIGRTAPGPVYYRLKQVDTDGTGSYSPVRTVAFTKAVAPAIGLYPNPATSATQLDLRQLPAGTYQVSVLDATGRVLRSHSLLGGLTHGLDLREVASGTYTLLVRGTANGEAVNLTKRLIKE